MFEQEPLNDGEDAYLHAISDLIEHYEEHNIHLPPSSDASVLQMLMESHGLNQSQFAEKIGVTKSIVSELVSGKRKLTRQQIDSIAKVFCVSKDTFSSLEKR